MALGILIAILLYRFVELPTRSIQITASRPLVAGGLVSVVGPQVVLPVVHDGGTGQPLSGRAGADPPQNRREERERERDVRRRVRVGQPSAEDERRERRPLERRPARQGSREEAQDARAPAGRASSTSITGMSETIG